MIKSNYNCFSFNHRDSILLSGKVNHENDRETVRSIYGILMLPFQRNSRESARRTSRESAAPAGSYRNDLGLIKTWPLMLRQVSVTAKALFDIWFNKLIACNSILN